MGISLHDSHTHSHGPPVAAQVEASGEYSDESDDEDLYFRKDETKNSSKNAIKPVKTPDHNQPDEIDTDDEINEVLEDEKQQTQKIITKQSMIQNNKTISKNRTSW